MGWKPPYLGGDLREDLVRILGWIDYLAADKGHPASTVDSYVTGTKQQLLEQFVISVALGRARERCGPWPRVQRRGHPIWQRGFVKDALVFPSQCMLQW
jgi:hypothetical protein